MRLANAFKIEVGESEGTFRRLGVQGVYLVPAFLDQCLSLLVVQLAPLDSPKMVFIMAGRSCRQGGNLDRLQYWSLVVLVVAQPSPLPTYFLK